MAVTPLSRKGSGTVSNKLVPGKLILNYSPKDYWAKSIHTSLDDAAMWTQ